MRVILFNLSPYRAQRENILRRRVLAELVCGLFLGLLFCYAVSSEFSERVSEKEQYLGQLFAVEAEVTSRVQKVEKMKERLDELNRQVNALKSVEKESLLASYWVSYLDETMPSEVSLTSLVVLNEVLVVKGFTDAVSNLAKWVDQMELGNQLFQSVDLVSVTVDDPKKSVGKVVDNQRHQFEIKAQLRGGQDASR
jgi:Tfp pilus assembly protein PilN